MISTHGLLKQLIPSVLDYVRRSGLPPHYILGAGKIALKRMAVQRFVEAITKKRFGEAAIICQHSLPDSNYVSWLLVRPMGIAYDTKAVADLSRSAEGNAPHDEVQIARAILHECGHIFGTTGLLSRRTNRKQVKGQWFTEPSTSIEEEKAWVWAMCALALALGHYAWDRRERILGDNSTSVAI